MKYTESLKEQIRSYLTYLDKYDSAAAEALQILEQKGAVLKEKNEEESQKKEEQLQNIRAKEERLKVMRKSVETLSEQIRQKIVEYTKYVAEIKEDVSKASAALLEKADVCDRDIQEKYAELQLLRKEYAEHYASLSNDPSYAEQKLENERKKFEEKGKKKGKSKNSLGLMERLDGNEETAVTQFFDLLSHVALNDGILKKSDYPDLLLLTALCSRRFEVALCVPKMEPGPVSIVCAEYCEMMCMRLAIRASRLKNHWTSKAFKIKKTESFGFRFTDGNVFPEALHDDFSGSRYYLTFSRDFLGKVLEILKENEEYDVFTLSDKLIEVGKAEDKASNQEIVSDDEMERDFRKDINEFKRLYYETPEERLVTEQRYFQQKLLEENQEKNRLLAQQMEEERDRYEEEQREEERRYREEQRERERRERELERERDRERWREEERERARKQEQKRAEDARRREEADRRRREDSATRHQCNTCANAGHCSSYMQRPNCAAYRPR